MNKNYGGDGMVKIPRIRLTTKGSSSGRSSGNNKNGSSTSSQSNNPRPPPVHVDQIRGVTLRHIGGGNTHGGGVRPSEPVARKNAINTGLGQEAVVDSSGGSSDEDLKVGSGGGVIKPKKLPNPIRDSVAMQSIHKELMLNQKIGRSVLTHKTELQRALEKLAMSKQSSTELPEDPTSSDEDDSDDPPSFAPNPPPMPNNSGSRTGPPKSSCTKSTKNEFERALDARARLIEEQKCFVDGERKVVHESESEFQKIHKRITTNIGGGV